jgi:hypothetical protein
MGVQGLDSMPPERGLPPDPSRPDFRVLVPRAYRFCLCQLLTSMSTLISLPPWRHFPE